MTFTEHRRLLTRMIVVNIVNSVAYRADFVMFMLGTILSPVISLWCGERRLPVVPTCQYQKPTSPPISSCWPW
jgi:hypothetical protein